MTAEYMAGWFHYEPVSRPAPKKVRRCASAYASRAKLRPHAVERQPAELRRASLNIAFLGTRGIPANYGGFETFAEELSTRLVSRGHKVTVYCREAYRESTYRGVHRQHLRAWPNKYAETLGAYVCFDPASARPPPGCGALL